MRFVPRTSVGSQLTIAIFLAILFSWILSAGTSSYITYQRFRVLHEEMLRRPDLYPVPIPEPRFGIMDFLVGPQPNLGRPNPPPRPFDPNRPNPQLRPEPPMGPLRQFGPPAGPMQPGGPPTQRKNPEAMGILITRMAIALLLAILAGKLLSARFTKRLDKLAKGASAFNDGNLRYRIDAGGEDEFAQVGATMNSMATRVSEQLTRLEDDAKRRKQILADVAHELRSPVATIRTMAGALEDGVANDQERKDRAVSALVRSSERLLHLVTDLLELARLDLNELPIHPQKVDLRKLAASAIDSHTTSAAQSKITLHPVASGAPIIADADPTRISQVLDNLINNAISYAGEGSQVRITLEPGNTTRIIVSDNGRGIPSAHLPYVFDSFYRADPARTPDSGHSGLGLRISRALIEAHKGTLTLSSRESQGTTATITLPTIP